MIPFKQLLWEVSSEPDIDRDPPPARFPGKKTTPPSPPNLNHLEYKDRMAVENKAVRHEIGMRQDIATKSWMGARGEYKKVGTAFSSSDHHIHTILSNPEFFDTTHTELHDLDPLAAHGTWSNKIMEHIGKKGFLRVANNSITHPDTSQPNDIDVYHVYDVSHHGWNGDNSSFVEPLKHIRNNITKHMNTPTDQVMIDLHGGAGGFGLSFTPHTRHRLTSVEDIDDFIASPPPRYEEFRRKSRDRIGTLPETPRIPNSTEIRDLIPKTPPADSVVPQAIWNNMRKLGDSYQPLQSFSSFIQEEKKQQTLGDHVKIKLNDPDADVWVTRSGSTKSVGAPTKEFSEHHFGVSVRNPDTLDPKYLYYMLQHIHGSKYYEGKANGATNLVHIKREHIANIPIG